MNRSRCCSSPQYQHEPAAEKYTDKVDKLVLRHHVIERVGKAHETSKTKQELKSKLDKINVETKQYMKGAENQC